MIPMPDKCKECAMILEPEKKRGQAGKVFCNGTWKSATIKRLITPNPMPFIGTISPASNHGHLPIYEVEIKGIGNRRVSVLEMKEF